MGALFLSRTSWRRRPRSSDLTSNLDETPLNLYLVMTEDLEDKRKAYKTYVIITQIPARRHCSSLGALSC